MTWVEVTIPQRTQPNFLKMPTIAGPKAEYGPAVRRNVGYKFLSVIMIMSVPEVQP